MILKLTMAWYECLVLIRHITSDTYIIWKHFFFGVQRFLDFLQRLDKLKKRIIEIEFDKKVSIMLYGVPITCLEIMHFMLNHWINSLKINVQWFWLCGLSLVLHQSYNLILDPRSVPFCVPSLPPLNKILASCCTFDSCSIY